MAEGNWEPLRGGAKVPVMRVVIHIGLHKTGTTALQSFLSSNLEPLKRVGILYCTPEGHKNHHPLALWLRTGTPKFNPELACNVILEMLKEAISSSCNLLLISSEMLCERPIDMAALRGSISSHDVRIIAYMRRPDEMVLSAYNQVVRDQSRWKASLAESCPYDPSYRNPLGQWITSAIGEVVLAPYDPDQWKERSLFIDFLSMLGVEDFSEFDFRVPPEEANMSLPTILIEVLRLTNQIGIDQVSHEKLVAEFYQLWKRHPDWFPALDPMGPEQRKQLCNRLAAELENYRPYFRPGFKEEFLRSPSNQTEEPQHVP